MDGYTLATILHVFGVALGAGGAFLSDIMFFSSVKDEKISETEMRFLSIGSKAVWIGISILIFSGIAIVLMNPGFLESSKFWAKMTIVMIIIANGLFFRQYHIPRLSRHVEMHFPSSDEFIRKTPLLLVSGVVSGVSWVSALVLGVMHGVPYSYWQIIGVYLLLLVLGIIFVTIFKKRLIAHPK